MPLTDFQFRELSGIAHRHAGIILGKHQRARIQRRLAERMRALDIDECDKYLAQLSRGDPAELTWLTSTITINTTAWFRESHHFQTLTRLVNERDSPLPIRVWSCACSSGEEPYSIAITLQEATSCANHEVVATDVDPAILESAKSGIYTLAEIKKIPTALQKHLVKLDDKKYQVSQRIRDRVSFRRLNLTRDPSPFNSEIDFLFCRNVMIYFDEDDQKRLVKRLWTALKKDGCAFTGHSESLLNHRELFTPVANTVYRKESKRLQ